MHMAEGVRKMTNKKKALVIRLGAYGDMIMIAPVLKQLHEDGYHVILNTSKRGLEVFKHCSYVDEFIEHIEDSIALEDISKHWDKLKEEVNADKFINFSESLECNVALHPMNPMYIYPKGERYERCDRNYYDVTNEWSSTDVIDKQPYLEFSDDEIAEAKKHIKKDKINILWALSGSGKNKVYPWTEYVMGEIFANHTDIHIITIGDVKCQLLETTDNEYVTNLSGEIPMRTSMCLAQLSQLVVAPDTGILHAGGAKSNVSSSLKNTATIGLLGHTTKKNITKYFPNDYSVEAECACSPCFRLIYDYQVQCPLDFVTRAAWCMAVGLPPERVYESINRAIKDTRGCNIS